jgi:hypothetical protein
MMNRRSFLFISGSAVVGLAMLNPQVRDALGLDEVRVHALGRFWKGTREGRLFESRDQGKTWASLMNFGPNCKVLSIWAKKDELFVQLGIQQYSFQLKSLDGIHWATVS